MNKAKLNIWSIGLAAQTRETNSPGNKEIQKQLFANNTMTIERTIGARIVR